MAVSFTDGPGDTKTKLPAPSPSFPTPTPREGATGWWAYWNNRYPDTKVLQDYRGLAPVHGGAANLLFADGSVRSFFDLNHDGYLDNGLLGATGSMIELPPEDVMSLYSLDARLLP